MADFSKDQGGIQSSTSTEFDPIEAGVSKSGIDEAPKAALGETGPGPGIGNTRGGGIR